MARRKFLTDAMWKKLEPLLPRLRKGKKGGRPWADNRRCLEGILWILKTGASWHDLPEEYPSPSTCWRRMYLWAEAELWHDIWQTMLGELDAKGRLEWEEVFMDGSFAPAKGGRRGGENQAGQGFQVDGCGRRQGDTSRRPRCICDPGGSHACGSDAEDDPGSPSWPRPSETETEAGDCGQGV